jgi:AraC-like DNA-binding protein
VLHLFNDVDRRLGRWSPDGNVTLPAPGTAGTYLDRPVTAGMLLALLTELPLEARGAFLSELGLCELGEMEPDDRVPRFVLDDVWTRIPLLSGDHDFGLSFAKRADARYLGLLGYLARHSATVVEGIERVVRFQRLVKDAADVCLTPVPGGIAVSDGPALRSEAWPRHLAEAVMGAFVTLPSLWCGERVTALGVSFQHSEPASLAGHHELFGCKPRFSAPRNEITFASRVATLPMRDADPILLHYLEQAAEARLEQLPRSDEWVERAARAIEANLGSELSLERVARNLGMGARTLQRRFADLGLSYQSLLDGVRQREAERLLGDRRLAVDEISLRLGFSDPSGFRRAHQRWYGRPPREGRA